MNEILKLLTGAIAIVVALLLLPMIGTIFGAICGWVVGLVFTDTILYTLGKFGVDTFGLAVWQIGATAGFLGGFFKSSNYQYDKS